MVFVCGGISEHSECIFKLQKKILRIISGKSYRSHTDPLFKTNNILKLSDLHKLNVLLFIHDSRTNKLPKSFDGIFIAQNRHEFNMMRHIPRTKFSSKCPIHHFPQTWNQIDRYLKSIESRSKFKKSFINECLTKYDGQIN